MKFGVMVNLLKLPQMPSIPQENRDLTWENIKVSGELINDVMKRLQQVSGYLSTDSHDFKFFNRNSHSQLRLCSTDVMSSQEMKQLARLCKEAC